MQSKGALARVEKTISRRVLKEHDELIARLKKLSATSFSCQEDAMLALQKTSKGSRYHDVELVQYMKCCVMQEKADPKKRAILSISIII